MARRNRTRSRSRREALAARRATTPRLVEHDAGQRPTGYRPRAAGAAPRLGYSRAAGAPSAALERASVVERAYVVKDFRRLSITVGLAMLLLIAFGLLQSSFLAR
jgi:hypothetical protein